MDTFYAIAALVFGLIVGSFLNVVIFRVPRSASIMRPGSACPACGALLRPFDNIPVLSFIVLHGHCRACGTSISPRYPIVEISNAALWVACVLRFERTIDAVFVSTLASVLLALSVIDLEHRRLPNAIVLPGIVCATAFVGVEALAGDRSIFVRAIGCGAAAFMLFFVIALASGGMGFGDVKLAGLVGVVTGRFAWEVTVAAIFASFFVGGLVAILLLALGRTTRKARVPFGPSIAAGTLIALFAGPAPVRAWLGI